LVTYFEIFIVYFILMGIFVVTFTFITELKMKSKKEKLVSSRLDPEANPKLIDRVGFRFQVM